MGLATSCRRHKTEYRMFVFHARIFHKWLILLAVPLLFEFVVGATLVYLQHYYGEALQVEADRKRIIYHTNLLWYNNTWIITNSLAAAFMGHGLDILTMDNAYREYGILQKMIATDPRQVERLDNIMLCHDRIKALCCKLKPYLPASGGALEQILALKSNLRTGKKIIEENTVAGDLIRSFRDYEIDQGATAAERAHTISRLIQLALVGAIAGSSVI